MKLSLQLPHWAVLSLLNYSQKICSPFRTCYLSPILRFRGGILQIILGHTFWNCCSVTKLCPTLGHSMDCSVPGFPVLHYLLEFAQTHVHWVDAAIQPSQQSRRGAEGSQESWKKLAVVLKLVVSLDTRNMKIFPKVLPFFCLNSLFVYAASWFKWENSLSHLSSDFIAESCKILETKTKSTKGIFLKSQLFGKHLLLHQRALYPSTSSDHLIIVNIVIIIFI